MIYPVFEIIDIVVDENGRAKNYHVNQIQVRIVFTTEFDQYVNVLPYLLAKTGQNRFKKEEVTMLKQCCPKVIKGYIDNGEFIPADKAFKKWVERYRKKRTWIYSRDKKSEQVQPL